MTAKSTTQKTSSFSPCLIKALQQTPSQQLSRTAALEAMGLKKTRATMDKLAEAIDALQLEGAVKKLGGHSVCLVGHMKRGGDPVKNHLSLKKPKPNANDPLVFYFVFAFTTNCQMDVLRMLSVNRHFPNYRCVPVGRSQRAEKDDSITGVSKSDLSLLELRRNSPYVVETDFGDARAFNFSSRVPSTIKTVKDQIEEDYKKKDEEQGTRTAVSFEAVLDYQWLETNYYARVYGGKWIRSNEGKDGSETSKALFAGSKVDALLKMGFSKVVLPIDHGIRHKGTLSYMENSLRAICCSEKKSDYATKQVQWKLTKMEEVPLWVASNGPEMEVEYEQEKRGGNVTQSLNYIVSPDKRQPNLCSNGPA